MKVLSIIVACLFFSQARTQIDTSVDLENIDLLDKDENEWRISKNEPIEAQIIHVTNKIYDEQITGHYFGEVRNTVPWVILFVDKGQNDSRKVWS